MKALLRSIEGILLSASLFALPALAAQPEDAFITTKVKMSLLTDANVNGLGIDVDTVDGRVTLHGKVRTQAEKTAAEALARNTRGVSAVRNLLAVVPESARKQVKVADKELASRVKTVLERDKALESSSIKVKSVNDGTVVLSGDAKTLSAHRHALEDARAVDGVGRVASEIRSPDELADAEIWEDAHPAAGSGMGAAASDAWITTKVRLMAKPGLSPMAVSVDTRQGIVTLFGTVETAELKSRAAEEARLISGVKGVENDLQVVPEVAAKRVEAADDQVEAAVKQRLDSRDSLDDADINVAVKNGVVRLTGTVETQRDRLTALTVARNTTGVNSVIDDLQVKPQG